MTSVDVAEELRRRAGEAIAEGGERSKANVHAATSLVEALNSLDPGRRVAAAAFLLDVAEESLQRAEALHMALYVMLMPEDAALREGKHYAAMYARLHRDLIIFRESAGLATEHVVKVAR